MAASTVATMCAGCGWKGRGIPCRVITDPKWIFTHRNGDCFAKATPEKVKEIEFEIRGI